MFITEFAEAEIVGTWEKQPTALLPAFHLLSGQDLQALVLGEDDDAHEMQDRRET